MSKKIAIVGAGALGGHVGAYLTKTGRDVTLIDAWPEHVETMRKDGLTLAGMTEPECFTVAVEALHVGDVQKVAKERPFDIAFVATKAYDTVWATALIQPYLAPEGVVVSLQNGINEERIASVVGWGKTIGCIAATISVALNAPGRIDRLVKLGGKERTVFRIGEPHGRISPRAEEIGKMLEVVDSVRVTPNLWGERWSKLVVNAMRNPVSAATGRGGNANDHDPHTRRLAIRIASEAIKVGRAHGYALESIYKMDPDQLQAAGEGDAAALEACEAVLLESTKFRKDEQRPSMGQDMLKGRRTEIDFINGLVVEKARELDIPVPANAGIVDAVRRIERGELAAGPEAVADL